jgi:hypothetical protein
VPKSRQYAIVVSEREKRGFVIRKGLPGFLSVGLILIGGSACNFEPPPKAYAQINLKHAETRIQMYTIMAIPSTEDCEAAFQEFIAGFQNGEGSQGWTETERACQETLEPMYQKVMNRETFHATYLAFTPKDEFQYEGRIVLYGIPSTQAQEICNGIAKDIGSKLGVDAQCVQGTVG